jgi:hypothetical protein
VSLKQNFWRTVAKTDGQRHEKGPIVKRSPSVMVQTCNTITYCVAPTGKDKSRESGRVPPSILRGGVPISTKSRHCVASASSLSPRRGKGHGADDKRLVHSTGRCKWQLSRRVWVDKPHGQLVSVGSTYYYAFTSDLSTLSSTRGL